MAEKDNIIDTRKTGPLGYRALQMANQAGFMPSADAFEYASKNLDYSYTPSSSISLRNTAPDRTYTPEQLGVGEDIGSSIFDPDVYNDETLANYQDVRAENQPTLAKWGAGLTKGVSLAATTFIDGTLGFLYGLGRGIYGATVLGEDASTSFSRLFDNEISNALQDWNNYMEEALPNYQTDIEKNRAWYENLGTANFWADSFLKNMGFAVGAYYSGGAWTKVLKIANLLKTGMAAKIVGSTLSAVNEGRIEALNTERDFKKLNYQQLEDTYRPLFNQIMSEPDTLEQVGENTWRSSKQRKLKELKDRYEEEKANIDKRAANAGLITLAGNVPLLTLNNIMFMGRAYARGFKNARDLANGTAKQGVKKGFINAGEEILAEEATEGIMKQGAKYAFNTTSKGKAILKGLGISINEGNEELAQAFVSDFAGNTQSYDSPDAYYLALTDPNAELKTKDMLTSITEGFMNTYGNGDRWEEFAVGALTGIIGMPTFGKVNNSDANTYLGRGMAVGLTGGIFGEMSYASNRNKEGQANVDAMNAFVDKYQAQKRYFAQSQSFTDAMDGWSKANDAFEFKNAEDNDAFSAISRFARAGRLNDLKEMVDNSFDNLTDEELVDIATNTTPKVGSGNSDTGGWRNLDGSLMSDTEEGRNLMRNDLGKKKETILSEIDNYQKSVETVRAIGNNSLTEDQVNELAWLNWKIGRFNDRFGSIKNENEGLFTIISNDLLNFRDSIDEKSEEGKKWLKMVNNYIDFVSYLQGSKSALDLANKIGDNKKLMEALASRDFYDMFTEHTSLDYSHYKNTMDNLIDAARLAKASKDFNTRYKEFVEDPIKLIQNREKIDKKKQKVNTTVKNIKDKDKIDNMSVADINNAVDNGDMSFDDIASILGTDDDFLNSITTDENGNPISTPIDEGDSTAKKVSEAKKKHDTASQITDELQTLADDGTITAEALNDALTLLNQSKSVSETEQEMLDTATEAYNNPDIIYNEDDPTIQQIQVNPEELASVLGDRLDSAKTAIEMAKAATKEKNDELNEIASTGQVTRTLGEEHLIGHDSVAKTESEQERKERLDKEQKQAAANKPVSVEERVSKVLEGALQNADSGLVNTTRAQVGNILNAIDKLIESGADNKEIGDTIKDMTQYDEVKQSIPDLDNRLNKYVTEQRTPKTPKEEGKPVEEEQYTPTQSITLAEIVASSRRESVRDNSQEDLPTYDYWKPTMTRHPIHRDKGNDTPYPVIARTLKKKDGVTPLYTEAQLQRMEAVDSYLRDANAYDRVDRGGVKVGDEIHFMVDSSLNEKAGDFVILMTDKNGNVIGDVMSPLDERYQSQVGLPQFIERVKKEYELAGKPDKFISKEISTVNKNMVGRVPYATDKEMHTLNEVHMNGSEQIPFKLGVALTGGQNAVIRAEAGRTKREGRSTMERTIQSPLSAIAGQPFLLMPTSSSQKAYVTVPITTPLFGQDLFDTSIGKSIRNVLGRVATSDNNNAINIIRDLKELIAIPEIHINYTDDNVKVTIKPQGATHQMTIYNGSKSSETLTDQLMLGLQGQPIQISRKYINDQYNGQDYNRMIGEIAQVNLPIGRTHTESDWFTINPIGVDGKQMKAKSPKNIGFNPNSSRSTSATIPYGRNGVASFKIDTNTFEVFDEKGNVYNGADKTIMQAHGWGFITNQNLQKPYHSPWGWYDPVEGKFIEEPKSDNIVTRTLGEEEVKKGPKQLTLTNPYTKATYVVKVGETRRINDGMYPGVSTIIDIKDDGTIVDRYYDETSKETSTREFSSERYLTELSYSTLVTSQDTPQTNTPIDYTETMKKAGLLGTKVRQEMWQQLTPEQQEKLGKKKGPQVKQWMQRLEVAYAHPESFSAKAAEILGTTLLRKEDGSTRQWNERTEMKWLSKVLPQFSNSENLRIVKGLIEIADGEGYAYGRFKDGIIEIGSKAARGTLYHEAFHAVAHTLLSKNEFDYMINQAKEYYNTDNEIAAEEEVAESFRRYVQMEETPVIGSIVRLFRTLKHLVMNMVGKESYLDNLFYRINRSKFSRNNIPVTTSSEARNNQREYSKSYHNFVREVLSKENLNNTSFPNSIIKNSVIHVSKYKIDSFNNINSNTNAPDTELGFFFSGDYATITELREEKHYAGFKDVLGHKVHVVDINLTNPLIVYSYMSLLPVKLGYVSEEELQNMSSKEKHELYKKIRKDAESKGYDGIQYVLGYEVDEDGIGAATPGYVVFDSKNIKVKNVIDDSEYINFGNSRYRQEEYTQEMKDILTKAPRDSQGRLLAPNGNPTNLTERQWLQVRTKAFKEWFGDWENPFSRMIGFNIIFGHPAIGKTTALQGKYKDRFIDWDVEYNEKRDRWIEEHTKTKKGTKEFKDARNKYLIYPENYPDYIEFLTREWNRVKNKAKQENKILLVSPHNLLKLFPNDFNYIIDVESNDFISRNINRGGNETNSKLWKEGIDKTISNVNNIPKYTIGQGIYLSDLLDNANNVSKVVDENNEPLVVYHGTQSLEEFSEFNKDTAIYTTDDLLTAISYVPDKLHEYTEKLTEGSSTKEVLDILQYYTSQLKEGEPFDYFDSNYTVLKRTLEPLGITVEEKNTYTIEDLEKYKNLVKATNIPIKLARGVDAFVKPLFGKIKNPIIIDAKGAMWNKISFNGKIYSTRELEQLYKNTEYDGIIIKNILDYAGAGSSPSTIYIQYNPNQIKSATDNIGTFSTTDNDIRYRKAPTVRYTIADVQSIVDSVVNTPIHRTKLAKNNAWGKLRDYYESQGIIVKGYKGRNGNYRVTSVKGDPTEYYRRIEQYHRDKLELGNLNQEDRNYITERGISESEYNSMSTLEKEVLFGCR